MWGTSLTYPAFVSAGAPRGIRDTQTQPTAREWKKMASYTYNCCVKRTTGSGFDDLHIILGGQIEIDPVQPKDASTCSCR